MGPLHPLLAWWLLLFCFFLFCWLSLCLTAGWGVSLCHTALKRERCKIFHPLIFLRRIFSSIDGTKLIPFVCELPLLEEHGAECLGYLKEDFPNVFKAKCIHFCTGLNNWGWVAVAVLQQGWWGSLSLGCQGSSFLLGLGTRGWGSWGAWAVKGRDGTQIKAHVKPSSALIWVICSFFCWFA